MRKSIFWLAGGFLVTLIAVLALGQPQIEARTIPITVNYSPGYGIKTFDAKGAGKATTIPTNTHLFAWRLTTINGVAMYQIGKNQYIPRSLTQRGRLQAKELNADEDELVNDTHFQGNVLLIDHYKISSVRSYGWQNTDKKIKNNLTTEFPIASAEKTFTAVLIAQLIAKNKLSYTSKLSQFYPDIPYASQITIRQLLDHRSGITIDEVYPDQAMTTETQAINWTLKNLHSSGKFDYAYANANFVLLAGIVRQVTKQSFATVLQKQILGPLKMTQTKNFDQVSAKHAALGYQYADGKNNVPQPISQSLLSSLLGTGSIYTSIQDLARFQLALDHQQLLSKAAFGALFTPTAEGTQYAGGWYRVNGQRYVHGSYNDFSGSFDSLIEVSPTGSSGVILLANQSTDTDTQQLANNLYQLVK